MGIKPDADAVAASYPDTAQERFGDLVNVMEEDGKAAGEAFAEVAATAESANSGAAELAADLTALESQPLLLWWDGNGAPPVLKPGWALLNTSNMQITF